jgi:hypothetical protein
MSNEEHAKTLSAVAERYPAGDVLDALRAGAAAMRAVDRAISVLRFQAGSDPILIAALRASKKQVAQLEDLFLDAHGITGEGDIGVSIKTIEKWRDAYAANHYRPIPDPPEGA